LITDFLPTGLVGLLLAAILSATMSTSSTCLICSTTCLTEDVIKPLWEKKTGKPYTAKSSLLLFRLSMVGVGLATIGITLWATDIIALITSGYAAAVAGLFVPFMCTLFVKKATKAAIYATMISGFVLYLIMWLSFEFGGITFGLPPTISAAPLYLTLPFSIVVMIVVTALTQKNGDHGNYDAYFDDEWENSPNNWEKHPEILEGRLDEEVKA
jgi:SSS family solute:Na+ symporter